jgi:hypothetical protein
MDVSHVETSKPEHMNKNNGSMNLYGDKDE